MARSLKARIILAGNCHRNQAADYTPLKVTFSQRGSARFE
jgi:hypothetical protein